MIDLKQRAARLQWAADRPVVGRPPRIRLVERRGGTTVRDAIGIRIHDLPLSPPRILAAIDAAAPADDTRPRLLMSPRGRLMEQAFYELDAPVGRVCTAEIPLPYAHQLELAALPSVDRIVDAAVAAMDGRALVPAAGS